MKMQTYWIKLIFMILKWAKCSTEYLPVAASYAGGPPLGPPLD